jgi:23S rRNA G2069 N7-methylase RlmK/C1962 C5-methylase RlmI
MAVEKYMEEAIAAGTQFDIVVLDPPKLAPNKKVLPQAIQKYTKLNAAAMQLVTPGGVLMTCSCSSAMTLSGEFTKMLVTASRKARRSITIVRDAGASIDHVLNPSFTQGRYLTNVTVIVH